ncbi:MAG: glycoside hydrolase family 16 protein [Clostridia bacterium]|nr:glycoside hydrolase family 16 protein [Clostridia bacterium]
METKKMISPISGKEYQLVFEDHFYGDYPNPDNWTIEDNDRYYNGEVNYKTSRRENVRCENSCLIIEAHKEEYKGKHYTSAAMDSHGKKFFKYGRFEMLAKLPYGKSMWPAFWTMGEHRGWPWGGEIDVMEMVGDVDGYGNQNGDSITLATLHWADPETPDYDHTFHQGFGKYLLPGYENGAKLNDEFHIYGVEWDENEIVSYFDDVIVGRIDIKSNSTMRDAFHKEHFMLLNLSLGGPWPGNPDETTVLPMQYQVDWVRVWQTVK